MNDLNSLFDTFFVKIQCRYYGCIDMWWERRRCANVGIQTDRNLFIFDIPISNFFSNLFLHNGVITVFMTD